MSKHTPGPWVIYPETDGQEIYAVDPAPGLAIRQGIALVCHGKNWTDNARLIAAAPELLEALESINIVTSPGNRTLDEMIRDMGFACDRARGAIAKAKGEA